MPRAVQDDWHTPDLARWTERVADTVAVDPDARWVAVCHSFGCLAIAHHLRQGGAGIHAALLVAPADPEKFSVTELLPHDELGIPSVLIGSETDPWMRIDTARRWSRTWGSQFINLGDVGHINTEAGFGPFPQAKTQLRRLVHRLERTRRLDRAHPLELSFAV